MIKSKIIGLAMAEIIISSLILILNSFCFDAINGLKISISSITTENSLTVVNKIAVIMFFLLLLCLFSIITSIIMIYNIENLEEKEQ